MNCPVCGNSPPRFKYWPGTDEEGGQVEPAEVACEDCGFSWQQYKPGMTRPEDCDVKEHFDYIRENIEGERRMLAVWERVLTANLNTGDSDDERPRERE